jgi:hypothetical protein
MFYEIMKALYTGQLDPGITLLDAVRGFQTAKKVHGRLRCLHDGDTILTCVI